jgi:uncharacterized protein
MPPRRHFSCALLALAIATAAVGAELMGGMTHTLLQIRSHQGRQWFNVYLARTEEQQERGLMFVRQLPADTGMLFPQSAPRPMTMWMKNTLIPLDMLFIDPRGRIVCLRERAEPESQKLIECPVAVAAVLEINGGEAARRGIRMGDSVDLSHASLQQ